MRFLMFHSVKQRTKVWHVPYYDQECGQSGNMTRVILFGLLLIVVWAMPCWAQMPRITTLFPIGGKAGSTVEVELRGSNLAGANAFLVNNKGVNGVVQAGDTKPDETHRPLWQAKCAGCHELRSPSNRSMTPTQWAATVERMVRVRQAPLSEDETQKVTQFLVSAARAGRVTAQIKIEKETLPGLVEVRVATQRGLSTAAWFEVGNLPEVVGVQGKREEAQPITLPVVANGCFSNSGERHFFKFAAKQGQRLIFNLKGFRYHEATQLFFNPNLRLYDAAGKEIAENHGYYALDPLLDWQCPTDGTYTLEVRDLLGRANPGSVYRLTMGAVGTVSYDTTLFPPGGQANAQTAFQVVGTHGEGVVASYSATLPALSGVRSVGSPFGSQPCVVTPYPVARDESGPGTPIALPAAFGGRIYKAGETDAFTVQGAGDFEFQVYAPEVGSPLTPGVQLVKADGSALLNMGVGRNTVKLEAGQTYSLRVGDGNRRAGPEYVYFIEARPARPRLELVSRPDNVTLRPGQATAVEVTLARREGVEGNIEVTAEDLPSGVTATKAILPPDRNQTWLILTAAPNAAPVEKPFLIAATGRGPLGEVRAVATPQEYYRLNNNPRYISRQEAVLTVRGQADFTASLLSEKPIPVHPKQAVEVKVKIKRREGYRGGIVVQMSGLPSGWTASPETLPADRDEVTLKVRPDGNNTQPFLNRDPKLTPLRAVIEASADDFDFVVGTLEVQAAKVNKNDLDD
jgi:hypothetical protein